MGIAALIPGIMTLVGVALEATVAMPVVAVAAAEVTVAILLAAVLAEELMVEPMKGVVAELAAVTPSVGVEEAAEEQAVEEQALARVTMKAAAVAGVMDSKALVAPMRASLADHCWRLALLEETNRSPGKCSRAMTRSSPFALHRYQPVDRQPRAEEARGAAGILRLEPFRLAMERWTCVVDYWEDCRPVGSAGKQSIANRQQRSGESDRDCNRAPKR